MGKKSEAYYGRKSIKDYKYAMKTHIWAFADKWGVIFEQEGEVGFGRECVGLLRDDSYIAINPTDVEGNDIPEFHNDKLYETCPKNAYHKHQCIAVLGRGDDAIRQLYEWVMELEKLNVTIEKYSTGATGIQVMLTGTHGYAVKIPKQLV